MNQGIVSSRYAKALLKFSLEKGEAEKVYLEMRQVVTAYTQVCELKTALANPVLSAAQKLALLRAAATIEGHLSASTERFLQLLVEKQREEWLLFIAQSYIDDYRKNQLLCEGTLTLAAPIGEEKLQALIARLQTVVTEKVEVAVQYDKSILGGFVFEYDNQLLDMSVKKKLSTIHRELR